MTARSPFNRPCLIGKDVDDVRSAVERGHISSAGSFADRAVEIPTAVHHAFLVAQLEEADAIQARRSAIANHYQELLVAIEAG
jgi:dTDP-4-amino-4,6-dideoxygalactose transaminase